MSAPQPLVFLSYAHEDGDRVLPDVALLEGNGLRVWYDKAIPGGAEWREYIAGQLSAADTVIAYLSRAWVASDFCRQEATFALDIGRNVVPVLLEDVELPPGIRMSLGERQWIRRSADGETNTFVAAVRRALNMEAPATVQEPATLIVPSVLRLVCGDDVHEVRSNSAGQYTIGRGADCSFRLRSDFVSRHHGYFKMQGGLFAFGDTSKNGTTLIDAEGETQIHQRQHVLPARGRLRFADLDVSFEVTQSLPRSDAS